MAVYAPDSGKDMEEYETFVEEMTKLLHERRRAEVRRLHIASDLNIEFGLLCTSDDDVGELSEKYGLQCWQSCHADPRWL